MQIGLLAWDTIGTDPDESPLAEFGRRRGHQIHQFALEDISYLARDEGGFDLSLRGEPAARFDAVISRAKLYGDDWRDRVERLTLLSNVLGPRLHSPADAWVYGYSKLLCTQRLATAGLPVPPTCSAATMADLELAGQRWGRLVVKPSYEYAGTDVVCVEDLGAQAGLLAGLLDKHGTLACMPCLPTRYGEYRLNVAGEACVSMLKLPPVGSWVCKTTQGATFERVDPPADLQDLAFRAARLIGLTLAGVDVLATEQGYVILEVNPVPGALDMLGEQARRDTFAGIYDWVEKQHG